MAIFDLVITDARHRNFAVRINGYIKQTPQGILLLRCKDESNLFSQWAGY